MDSSSNVSDKRMISRLLFILTSQSLSFGLRPEKLLLKAEDKLVSLFDSVGSKPDPNPSVLQAVHPSAPAGPPPSPRPPQPQHLASSSSSLVSSLLVL